MRPAPGLLVLFLLVVLLAPGHALGQGAVEQPAFDLPAVRDPQSGAQIPVANHFNYWKDEGLAVTVRWQQSGADIITLMASGQQGVAGGGSFAQIVLGGQKLPVRTIAPLADIAGHPGLRPLAQDQARRHPSPPARPFIHRVRGPRARHQAAGARGDRKARRDVA